MYPPEMNTYIHTHTQMFVAVLFVMAQIGNGPNVLYGHSYLGMLVRKKKEKRKGTNYSYPLDESLEIMLFEKSQLEKVTCHFISLI